MRVELRVVVENGEVTGVICSSGHVVDLRDERAVYWTWPGVPGREPRVVCGTHTCNVEGPTAARGGDHVKLASVLPATWRLEV